MGLILYAFGVAITIKADIGYAPWDVFHAGLAIQTGLTFGMASIAAGIVILVFVTLFKEKLGLGTILSMLVTGLLIDLIFMLDMIPLASGILVGIIMLVAGLFIISAGSHFYIKSAFGAGPRDNLMVLLTRKTKLPIGVCRGMVEITVTLIGWAIGGMAGIGTIISGVAIGFCIQITFAIFKFDATKIRHETLKQTLDGLIKRHP